MSRLTGDWYRTTGDWYRTTGDWHRSSRLTRDWYKHLNRKIYDQMIVEVYHLQLVQG